MGWSSPAQSLPACCPPTAAAREVWTGILQLGDSQTAAAALSPSWTREQRPGPAQARLQQPRARQGWRQRAGWAGLHSAPLVPWPHLLKMAIVSFFQLGFDHKNFLELLNILAQNLSDVYIPRAGSELLTAVLPSAWFGPCTPGCHAVPRH